MNHSNLQNQDTIHPPTFFTPNNRQKVTKHIQSINGFFLDYARAVDPPILLAINEISSQQTKPTSMMEDKSKMLMGYAATHSSAKIRHHASETRLHVGSDVAYLVLPQTRSRGVENLYLRSSPTSSNIIPSHRYKGPILTECITLKNIMSSAAEAEAHTLHHNGKKVIIIRTTLQ